MILDRALPDPHLGVVHGFTNRSGGVSEGSLASLNLALRLHERPENLTENWRRVLAALHPSLLLADLALVEQVHGSDVCVVERGRGPLAVCGTADALVTTVPGVVLAIRTADCVPVLFSAPGGVAAAHAGWRGVASCVVAATVQRLCAVTGCAPGDVRAAIGPHISAEAYEVGWEVVDGLAAAGLPIDVFVRGHRHVDLRAAVSHQLVNAGVRRVGHVVRCTARDEALFSHRADGPGTGRLGAVIACLG